MRTTASRALRRALASAPAEPPARHPWGLLGVLLATETAVTGAILYYVGWMRADETYKYFGVDLRVVGLSGSDYVLRSMPSVLPAMVLVSVLVIIWTELSRRIVMPRLLALEPSRRGWLGRASWGAAAVLLLAFGVFYLRAGNWFRFGLPLLLTAAACLAALGRRVEPLPSRIDELVPSLIMLIGVAGAVWALALYGQRVGHDAAVEFERKLPTRPGVTVYSDKLLVLPGALFDRAAPSAPPTDPAYQYRYQGLRLLNRAADGYLLVPAAWQHGDPVFLVQVGDGVRLDFSGG